MNTAPATTQSPSSEAKRSSPALQIFGILHQLHGLNNDTNVEADYRCDDIGFYKHFEYYADKKELYGLSLQYPTGGVQLYHQKTMSTSRCLFAFTTQKRFILCLLLSEGIATNPGPVKFPCGACSKPPERHFL